MGCPSTYPPRLPARSTVVRWWDRMGAVGTGWRGARHPSTTVTGVPAALTSPATGGGAPGIRVVSSRGRISRTRSASAAQTRVPTRNSSRRTTPASLIRCEEAKILQRVALSKQSLIGGGARQCGHEVGGPFRAQIDPRAGDRVVEGEPGGVQQLARRQRFELLRRPPLRR